MQNFGVLEKCFLLGMAGIHHLLISSFNCVLTLHAEPANFEANETFSVYSTDQVDARES